MIRFTIQLPDELANRQTAIQQWAPTILELSLKGFKTPAAITATKIVEFLSGNPSPEAVFHYHVSKRAQKRLRHRLALIRDYTDLNLSVVSTQYPISNTSYSILGIEQIGIKSNIAGQVSPDEERELDEIEKIEHIMMMLKAQLAPALYEK